MAGRFVIPDELARAAGNEGRGDWLVGLPVLVAQIAADWQIHIGDLFVPGGATSWVAPGRDHAGTDVVLKVCWPHPGAAHEADGLGTWAGDGAIRLCKATELAEASVLLLERRRPGTQPQQAGRDRSPAWRQRQPVVVAPKRIWTLAQIPRCTRGASSTCLNSPWPRDVQRRLLDEAPAEKLAAAGRN